MESGRLINVYDWFQSFAVALEEEERLTGDNVSTGERQDSMDAGPSSPSKRRRRGVTSQEEREKRTREMQARFMRAVHELDYLGFIKPTGRKRDHVMKTVFDIPDTE